MAMWDKIGSRGEVDDRRGMSGFSFGSSGTLIALVATLALSYFGINVSPATVESVLSGIESLSASQADKQEQPPEFRGADSYETFAATVLGSTNDTWRSVFAQNNVQYVAPKLVLFRGMTNSGCGMAATQIGPHYCPADQTIYLDETFFDELHNRFGASKGEVAQAYVIAHEVGHHVQNIQGALSDTRDQTSAIAIELQADCYAGIWAYSTSKLGVFENGEIQQAMDMAAAVGDDSIQEKTTGRVEEESWTHGSSEQRVNAFTRGYDTGDPAQCSI